MQRDRRPLCGRTIQGGECLVLVLTSIVDTESPKELVTKTVLPLGVTATAAGVGLTVMSLGCFVLVFTSIVDTEPVWLVTKAVARHRDRPAATDTPSGNTPTS